MQTKSDLAASSHGATQAGNVLTLAGWQGSGPSHWQSRWEQLHGYVRIKQHDWLRPLRGDWMAQLEDVLLSLDVERCGRAVLVAHSLGCLNVVAWAAHSRNTHLVKAALLVAPPDVERDELRSLLPSWSPIALNKLPFQTVLMASSNDPFCRLERAWQFATAWGAEPVDAGPRGHLNANSALGDWPEGYDKLMRLTASANAPMPQPNHIAAPADLKPTQAHST